MIGYHPALDPAHAAFRATRLLLLEGGVEWERDRLRIADFLLLFPAFITSMQLPREHLSWRSRMQEYKNRYWYSADPRMLFRRMGPLHEAGVHLLMGVGAIPEAPWISDGKARLEAASVPKTILEKAITRNEDEATIVAFLRRVVLPIRLTGPQGLKARTRLLEYRYDPD